MTSTADALASLRQRFAAFSTTAALDAEILLAQVLGTNRAALAARPGRTLAPSQAEMLETLASRSIVGEPIAIYGAARLWPSRSRSRRTC